MVLYALANGRIAPAQAIRPRGNLATEVLGALRESILDVVDVPLLPVMWEESDSAGKHGQSLVAIDQDGTVVMVNIRQRLTSVGQICAYRARRHGAGVFEGSQRVRSGLGGVPLRPAAPGRGEPAAYRGGTRH